MPSGNRTTLPSLGRDAASVRQRIEMLEQVLEELVTIPGTNQRVGLDAILGFIPVVGDLVTAAMGSYLIWEARNLGLSKIQLVRMAANVGIDTAIGAVPVVGDLFDLAFRSNRKNLRIIRRHLDKHHPATVILNR
jgi:hypothetical protein